MITELQIAELTKDGSTFYSECVLLIDTMRGRINDLESRVKQLETRDQQQPKLKLVGGDGQGH
jgi:hypothetical protein